MSSTFVVVVLSAFIFSIVDAQMSVSTCGTMKGCLFAPPGCQPSTDCQIAFSYQVDGPYLSMELSGTPPTPDGFIAVGFSNDPFMGDDMVVYCANSAGQVTAGLANRQWGSVHAMLGLVACVVAWAQPLNAVFRCHPEEKGRFIFNWIHGFLGFGAWLCAASATMISVVHFAGMFSNRDAALGIYIAFIVVTGLTVITMEILTFKSWWMNRDCVTSEIEMTHVGGNDSIVNRNEIMKIRAVQLLLLMIFVVVAIGTAVAISVLIANRPKIF
ncbi:unnamed protein product [Angiostrongylus costaricensis]|uniref:Cytochrome b561 domain-containing protein n=1 Tax=Angiostrongylus costaricensis TaxID=334426 RepID=A0A158PD82_ANGCS|nr:unnamed protein product [Angiostrongylus costaricensis]